MEVVGHVDLLGRHNTVQRSHVRAVLCLGEEALGGVDRQRISCGKAECAAICSRCNRSAPRVQQAARHRDVSALGPNTDTVVSSRAAAGVDGARLYGETIFHIDTRAVADALAAVDGQSACAREREEATAVDTVAVGAPVCRPGDCVCPRKDDLQFIGPAVVESGVEIRLHLSAPRSGRAFTGVAVVVQGQGVFIGVIGCRARSAADGELVAGNLLTADPQVVGSGLCRCRQSHGHHQQTQTEDQSKPFHCFFHRDTSCRLRPPGCRRMGVLFYVIIIP